MTQANVAAELDELLSESAAAATERVARQARALETGNDLYALYGAGQLGRWVLARMRAAGAEPVAFADDTPEKEGQTIDGLPVMTPQTASEKFGSRLVFVVTILNPLLNFVTARRRLKELTGMRVLSFLHLAWRYPESFLPYCQFELPLEVLKKRSDIRRGFQLFADEESRRQFAAHLRFRLHLDYDALPKNSHDDYFPPDLLDGSPDNTVFVDCGAYDGDTVRKFLDHQQGDFARIFAFEPDQGNFRKLKTYVAGLPDEIARKITIYNAGVGASRGKMAFNATGNMSASFAEAGEAQVDVLALQEIITAGDEFIYLKFDVEGAEWEALAGAETLLAQARPLLAVSVYHRPNDLWQLPLYIDALGLGYRFFLRTQGEDGMDAICYAVPPDSYNT